MIFFEGEAKDASYIDAARVAMLLTNKRWNFMLGSLIGAKKNFKL